MKRTVPLLFAAALAAESFLPAAQAGAEANDFDIVVYGGTAGGAITAVSAARMGL